MKKISGSRDMICWKDTDQGTDQDSNPPAFMTARVGILFTWKEPVYNKINDPCIAYTWGTIIISNCDFCMG